MTEIDRDRRPIVVTGGSGFIGTHLVNALLARGRKVVNLDLRAPVLAEHRPHWVEADLLDQAKVSQIVKDANPEAIINLAAYALLSGDPGLLRVNTEGCRVLLAATDAFAEPPLIVHTSTQLAVGPGYKPAHLRDFAPYTDYGVSKAESEKIFFEVPAKRWVIVRPTVIWGAYHPTFGDAIIRYIAKRYYMHPSGRDPVRSYGYVENVAWQMLRVLDVERSAVEGQIFYVGDEPIPSAKWLDGMSYALTGKPVRRFPRSLLHGAAMMGELSGKIGGPSPINLGRWFRMTTDYAVPMEKTFEVLGHGPIAFDEGIRRTAAWYRARSG